MCRIMPDRKVPMEKYTWGDDQFGPPWGCRAHQMDVETPTRGIDRTEGFAPERRRIFCRGTLADLDLGGLSPFQWNVGLGRPRTSPKRFMTSSFLHEHFDRWTG
jgi:hypothetical protein